MVNVSTPAVGRHALRVVNWLALVALVGLLGTYLARELPHLDFSTLRVAWPLAGASLAIATFATVALAITWCALLRAVGVRIALVELGANWGLSLAGRYVPGKIATPAYRALALKQRHGEVITTRGMVFAWGIEGVLSLGAGLLLAALLAWLAMPQSARGLVSVPTVAAGLATLAATGAGVALAIPDLRARLLSLAGVEAGEATLSLSRIAVLVLAYGLTWLLLGISLWLAVLALPVTSPPPAWVVCVFALSNLAGVLSVVTPSGLGVREGVIVLLLGPAIGADAAVLAAVLSRCTIALSEGLVFLASFAWLEIRGTRAAD